LEFWSYVKEYDFVSGMISWLDEKDWDNGSEHYVSKTCIGLQLWERKKARKLGKKERETGQAMVL